MTEINWIYEIFRFCYGVFIIALWTVLFYKAGKREGIREGIKEAELAILRDLAIGKSDFRGFKGFKPYDMRANNG